MRSPPIRDREHDADEIIRHVLTEVRKTFLTPFDRGAITSLIGAMDDAIDEMLAAARAIDLYELRELRPEMKEIVSVICEAASVTAEAVPLLRNVSANGDKLHGLTGRLVSLEGKADEIHAARSEERLPERADRSTAIRRRAGGVQEPRTGHGCIRGRRQRDRRHRHRPCITWA